MIRIASASVRMAVMLDAVGLVEHEGRAVQQRVVHARRAAS